MAITAKAESGKGGVFVQASQGVHQAVIADVIDLGMVESTVEGQKRFDYKIQVVYQLKTTVTEKALRKAAEEKSVEVTDEMLKDRVGKRIHIRGARFNLKLSFRTAKKQTALTDYLCTVLGRDLSDDERAGYDVENVIGTNVMLTVLHKKGE